MIHLVSDDWPLGSFRLGSEEGQDGYQNGDAEVQDVSSHLEWCPIGGGKERSEVWWTTETWRGRKPNYPKWQFFATRSPPSRRVVD